MSRIPTAVYATSLFSQATAVDQHGKQYVLPPNFHWVQQGWFSVWKEGQRKFSAFLQRDALQNVFSLLNKTVAVDDPTPATRVLPLGVWTVTMASFRKCVCLPS